MAGQGQGIPTPAAPPAPPAQPVIVQGIDLAGLQAQAADLRIQLSGLQAQWDGLKEQLDNMLRNNPARPGVQQTWADIGVQRAQVQGDLARVEARIAQIRGERIPGTVPPARIPGGGLRPSVVAPSLAVVAVLLFPVSIAWAKRIMRRTPRTATLPTEHLQRLERMEHAIDAVAIEVERISESQRFMTRVLVERPDPASDPVASAPAESAQRALGAGPAEPIRMAERERAWQPIITPR